MTTPGGDRIPPPTRWSEVSQGAESAAAYRRRFADLEQAGADLHGEARFVASVVPPPARVLDAGCGFGRLTRVLTVMGYDAVGLDADRHLIDIARREDPATEYIHADLLEMDLSQENLSPRGMSTWAGTRGFRVAVLAGGQLLEAADGVEVGGPAGPLQRAAAAALLQHRLVAERDVEQDQRCRVPQRREQ